MGRILDIQTAMDYALSQISGAPTIVWENGPDIEMTLSSSYWRPTLLTGKGSVAQADMLQKITGIYQVDIFVPSNRGTSVIKGYYDSIFTAFNVTTNISANSTKIYIGDINPGAITQDKHGWCQGFIEINYDCFTY